MQVVTIGSKYQIVIPKEVRKKEKGLQPGAKALVGHNTKGEIIVKPVQESWVDRTYGMMAEAWKDIDPIAEVEKMKDEWEERLEELDQIRQGKDPFYPTSHCFTS